MAAGSVVRLLVVSDWVWSVVVWMGSGRDSHPALSRVVPEVLLVRDFLYTLRYRDNVTTDDTPARAIPNTNSSGATTKSESVVM